MRTKLAFLFLLTSLNFYAQGTYESINADLQKIKATSKIDGKDKRVFKLLEKFHDEGLQSDSGGLPMDVIATYKSYSEDPSLPNSHILYLFNRYQTEIINPDVTSDFQIACMKLLSGECIETYNAIPAVIVVYMGEALMSANMDDKAKAHFETASGFYPDSVPIRVYNCVLADVGPKKEKMKKALLKKHPNHWMVKEMVK